MGWYVIYTKPSKEDSVTEQLRNAGIEVLNPKVILRKYRNGKIVSIIEPLFPNYIFADFDLMRYHRMVKYTRGVRYIIFRDRPVELPDFVVTELKSRADDNGFVKIESGKLNPDDRVVIKSGPFKDFYGIFEKELNREERVLILLEILNARIEIDKCMIEKV
ncbi:MAG: transcription termination/antitermination NusG family protein [Candidatus Aenigmatarchaeota archaeon]